MSVKTFTPNPKYMTKQRVAFGLLALLPIAFFTFLATVLTLDGEFGAGGALIMISVAIAIVGVLWVIAAALVIPYYNSLRYEIHDDEVIVHVGIVTKSVKHVPYRTVTNIVVNRGILDRFFGLGTLNIQTAGMSGQTGAEEALVGLPNVQEVYDLVATELRRFRAGMSPTGADADASQPVVSESAALAAILAEVKAIRTSLEA
jgi:membrane protein YdbS with pleckstrin-like domain